MTSMRRLLVRLQQADDLTRVGLLLVLLLLLVVVLAFSSGSPPILGGVSNGVDLRRPNAKPQQTGDIRDTHCDDAAATHQDGASVDAIAGSLRRKEARRLAAACEPDEGTSL